MWLKNLYNDICYALWKCKLYVKVYDIWTIKKHMYAFSLFMQRKNKIENCYEQKSLYVQIGECPLLPLKANMLYLGWCCHFCFVLFSLLLYCCLVHCSFFIWYLVNVCCVDSVYASYFEPLELWFLFQKI